MKRFIALFTLLLLAFAAPAFAAWWNPVDWVKSALEGGGYTILAYALTAGLAFAIFGTVFAVKIVKTLKEAGELLIALSEALSDRKVTPEEIKAIIADIRSVLDVWKKTPDAYKPPVT
jgi:divalent metal cation (Fe/Co/Zn/Cd) transporter